MSTQSYPNNIRKLRKSMGVSARDIADMIGCGHSTVHNLEHGKRKLTEDWMRKIAEVLGCRPSDLLISDTVNVDAIARQNLYLNSKEKKLIEAYRNASDDLQEAILTILKN